ncbi:MAG: hypothetical protein J2P48_03610 [Alphaproteobacteria bacterium]|nr:hypothetical protein [Alphaproteobacteria bacterium]
MRAKQRARCHDEAPGRLMLIGMKNDFERKRAAATKRTIEYAYAHCGVKERQMLTK